jgi:hypothetical protein
VEILRLRNTVETAIFDETHAGGAFKTTVEVQFLELNRRQFDLFRAAETALQRAAKRVKNQQV